MGEGSDKNGSFHALYCTTFATTSGGFALGKKDAELRQKQREINQLYGKLAAGSELTDPELRSALTAALQQFADLEEHLAAIEGKDQQ